MSASPSLSAPRATSSPPLSAPSPSVPALSSAPALSRYAIWFRVLAIGIAIAGIIDPSFRRQRRVKPEVSVVAGADASAESVRRVRATLGEDFNLLSAPFPGASATVAVGTSLPRSAPSFGGPVFMVLPSLPATHVSITGVHHAPTALLDASTMVETGIELATPASGAAGDSVVVTLHERGVVTDRVSRALRQGARRATVPVAFTPARTGLAALHVEASVVKGGRETASSSADIAIDVRDSRGKVLFHDARPSWMSTFVRRSLELDPRFTVTSRTVTSRGIATESGRPPSIASLDGATPFDVVVIGAPESLGAREVESLEGYLRRGGSVVLLLDQQVAGPYQRLARAADWRSGVENEAAGLTAAGGIRAPAGDVTPDSIATLRVTEWVAPRLLPEGAAALLTMRGQDRPVVWRTNVGTGTLVVSGALDAWRYRDSTQSGFAPFWRNLVSTLSQGAIPQVHVSVEPEVAVPGGEAVVRLDVDALRQPSALAAGVEVSAVIEPLSPQNGDSTQVIQSIPLRLWPTAVVGELEGRLRMPVAAGHFRVSAVVAAAGADTARGTGDFVVEESATGGAGLRGASGEMLDVWARSHGGSTVAETDLGRLHSDLEAAIQAPVRIVEWHPMRSAWWTLPFALLLCAEWWIRRRRGLA